MNDSCARNSILYSLTLVIGCIITGACSSGSSSDTASTEPAPELAVTGQAVDGYIVGGRTFCDEVEKEVTKAAGRYSCPNGTKIVKVFEGVDVGYDEAATTSDVAYNGTLIGPTSFNYITPVTTLVTELAGGEENYDSSKLNASISQIKSVLNIKSLNLNNSPAADIEMARLNAQLHRIVGTFSVSRDEYEKVNGSLADLIEEKAQSSETIDINGSDESKFTQTLLDLIQKVKEKHSDIEFINDDNIDIEAVIDANLNDVKEIQETNNSSDLKRKPTFRNHALAFSTKHGIVMFTGQDDETFSYSVKEFEKKKKNNQGEHHVVLSRSMKRISLDKSMIRVEKTLINTTVDFAFSLAAENDPRELNVIAKDIKVSMVEGDSSSIEVTIPDGTVWQVQGVSKDGTSTQVDIEKDGDRIFSSSKDGINLDFDYVADQLQKKGHPDLTKETGNFRVTCVISGIEVARLSGSKKKQARIYVVRTDDSLLRGRGLRGFVTLK
jgi:hypothetical protein